MFRLGIVGGGRMGKTHMRALRNSLVVEVAAVAEPDTASATRLRLTGATVYSTVAEMLGSAVLDGVLIAAPSGYHVALVEQIAHAGLPILCEKPCGLSAGDARIADVIARQCGVFLQIGYWRRFVPSLQELRTRILDGSMGTLLSIECGQWDERPPAAEFRVNSGGIFIDMGVHEIDQILWLTGQTVSSLVVARPSVAVDGAASGDVDSAQALLSLSGGTVASISLGRFFPGGDRVIAEVFGSAGHARVTVLEPASSDKPQTDALRRQAEAFAAHCRGKSYGSATADDAATALDIAHELTIAAGLAVLGRQAP